jgi:Uma2 family endonuclease
MTIATMTPPPVDAVPRSWKWSTDEYCKLGHLGFFQGKRVELIRGEIVEMSPIGWPHALATHLVMAALSRIFTSGYWLSEQKPFPIIGSSYASEPEPDVAVIPGSIRDYANHPTAAVLIVEVADTTLFYDTTTKAELYATAGIEDYWVLDLVGKRLQVFRDPVELPSGLGTTAYQTHFILGPADTISPLDAPNSSIAVSDLLP